ncbi:GNAT family N-acetyltransferase [Pseudomonas indica]|uniref:GNAT family N-acetyltransferase n=1 Tax=Pseudomonas indica TaxID=137658 RepID=UPI0023F740DC|nr:GNAT family N-acetyltransferase [Pseudomonas indica]MBU3056088.1 GNAT family N-acetyltransferase [Pseudomonas indica]
MDDIVLRDWHELSARQRLAFTELRIDNEQQTFAGRIDDAIRACEQAAPCHLRGLAVLHNERPVGFLLLKRPPLSPAWAPDDAITLHALQIDLSHQGRGYGRSALAALPSLAMRAWPQARYLALSVDAHNAAAMALYVRSGWLDSGQTYQGRLGLERRFNLPLFSGAHQPS